MKLGSVELFDTNHINIAFFQVSTVQAGRPLRSSRLANRDTFVRQNRPIRSCAIRASIKTKVRNRIVKYALQVSYGRVVWCSPGLHFKLIQLYQNTCRRINRFKK